MLALIGWLPKLSIGFSYEISKTENFGARDSRGYSALINLSWPLDEVSVVKRKLREARRIENYQRKNQINKLTDVFEEKIIMMGEFLKTKYSRSHAL